MKVQLQAIIGVGLFLSTGALLAQEQEKNITVEEYCIFLNQQASNDTHHLDESSAPITRLGEPGAYHYKPAAGKEKEAIVLLSGIDAMRFCNWKNNPKDTIPATEQGTYEFEGDQLLAINTEKPYLLRCSPSLDPFLKSNQLTFQLGPLEVKAYQAGGEEEIVGALEETTEGSELVAGIASLLIGGITTEQMREPEANTTRLERHNNSPAPSGEALNEADVEKYLTEYSSTWNAFEKLRGRESTEADMPLKSEGEEEQHLSFFTERLPRTGFTAETCTYLLKSFPKLMEKNEHQKEIKKELLQCTEFIAQKRKEATQHFASSSSKTDPKKNWLKVALEKEAELLQKLTETENDLEKIAKELYAVSVSLRKTPPETPEENRVRFIAPYDGIGLGSAKEIKHAVRDREKQQFFFSKDEIKHAFRERQQALASRDASKIKHYLLSSFSVYWPLHLAYLRRQATLHQRALFEKEGYWLDFSDPLQGPHYSFSKEEIDRRLNQAHAHFVDAGVIDMMTMFGEPLFKQSAKSMASCKPTYSLGLAKHDLMPVIQGTITPRAELNEIVSHLSEQNASAENPIKKTHLAAKGYLNFLIGKKTEVHFVGTKAQHDHNTAEIKTLGPTTRKYFLAQQLARDTFGHWTADLFNNRKELKIASFSSYEPIEVFVHFFHRQCIQAASFFEQTRLLMLPEEERKIEISRLQALTPEQREADLFEKAGITDWKLPTTPEELHTYVHRGAKKITPTSPGKKIKIFFETLFSGPPKK